MRKLSDGRKDLLICKVICCAIRWGRMKFEGGMVVSGGEKDETKGERKYAASGALHVR